MAVTRDRTGESNDWEANILRKGDLVCQSRFHGPEYVSVRL